MELSKRVAIAHDYFTQRGGAERVALLLADRFGAPVYTAFVNADSTFPQIEDIDVRPSALNRIPFFRRDPRRALPLLPLVWGTRRRARAEIVICSTSGWAHAQRVSKCAIKIAYCHNPARWIYQPEDYLKSLPSPVRTIARCFVPMLRAWDRRMASSVDVYIANSTSVAERIKAAYGRDCRVIFPPVTIDPDGELESVEGLRPASYFLTVGRSRGYKGTQLLEQAFASMPSETLVIVGGEAKGATPTARHLGRVSEAQLRWLYRNAIALVSVSREDFGLTPVEANAMGTPVLLLRAGGFLDSTVEGHNGFFIEHETVDSIVSSVERFQRNWDRSEIIRYAERFSVQSFIDSMVNVIADAGYKKDSR